MHNYTVDNQDDINDALDWDILYKYGHCHPNTRSYNE